LFDGLAGGYLILKPEYGKIKFKWVDFFFKL